MQRTAKRILAGIGGAASLLAAAWMALIVTFVSVAARAPDASVENTDPSSYRPGTWSETALGILVTLIASLVPALLATLGAAWMTWSVTGRLIRRRAVVGILAGVPVAACLLLLVNLGTTLGG